MRVLHVVPSYLPAVRYGGPIYSVHGLCAGLAQRGWQVDVYTTNVDGPGVSDVPVGTPVILDGVNVTYFETGLGRRIYRSPTMRAALAGNASAYDAIHLHSVFLWPTTAGAMAARSAKIPYVLSPRGMLVPELIRRKSWLPKSAAISLFERRNVANAASVHVTADLEGQDLKRLGLRARRIDVVPNGFDLPPEAIEALKSATVGQRTEPVVLSLGRISWKKGLDRLIPAMAQVPQAQLVIAGNDDEAYAPHLEMLIAKHGLATRARLVGQVHGMAKWREFANADIFALASYSENFGIAVLEAMACGLPVVVTPEVGLAKIIEQTGAGIVAAGDPLQFGQAIARLAADPDLRQKMGAAGRRAAAELFSWSSVAERMERIYRDIIHDK